MSSDIQKPDLQTRLQDAVNAIKENKTPEPIRGLFTEACDEIIQNAAVNTLQSKKNLMLMQKIAIGPSGKAADPDYTQAFISICGNAAQELRLKEEKTLSSLMASMSYGLDLFTQAPHSSTPEANPTPSKAVNKDENKLIW